jgi:hypothetical protein
VGSVVHLRGFLTFYFLLENEEINIVTKKKETKKRKES